MGYGRSFEKQESGVVDEKHNQKLGKRPCEAVRVQPAASVWSKPEVLLKTGLGELRLGQVGCSPVAVVVRSSEIRVASGHTSLFLSQDVI